MSTNRGIYQIKNVVTGDCYVGRSSNLRNRRYHHFADLSIGNHCNIILQNAWNKYGEQNFIFEVLEYVDSINDLMHREHYYILLLRPRYNIMSADIGTLKHSEETIEKIKQNHRGGPFIGHKVSNETRKKISLANCGKTHSEKAKQKMRGRVPKNSGFSDDDIREIKWLFNFEGLSLSEIARRKNTFPQQIRRIINGESYRRVV